MAEAMGKTVKVKSEDKQVFEIEEKAIKLSGLISDMLSLSVVDNGEEKAADKKKEVEDEDIPQLKVDAKTLKLVVDWCQKHAELKSGRLADFDDNFVKAATLEELFALLHASSFLQIPTLADIVCEALAARLLLDKSPEDLRALLRITPDFTPEEEARIRDENAWCED